MEKSNWNFMISTTCSATNGQAREDVMISVSGWLIDRVAMAVLGVEAGTADIWFSFHSTSTGRGPYTPNRPQRGIRNEAGKSANVMNKSASFLYLKERQW